MDAVYPPLTQPATPEYAYALLTDMVPDAEPSMSIREVLGWFNDLTWPTVSTLAKTMRRELRLTLTVNEWQAAFPTLSGVTVWDVCVFAAPRMTMPAVRPWRADPAAGAFLTVRSMLADAGEDADAITPAAPLEPYLRRRPWLYDELFRLAPGRVPPLRVTPSGWLPAGCATLVAGFAATLLAAPLVRFDERFAVLGILVCPAAVAGMGMLMFSGTRPPRAVALGDLVTFRDLAYAVAGQVPRRAVQRPA